jgi:hypothetical protein
MSWVCELTEDARRDFRDRARNGGECSAGASATTPPLQRQRDHGTVTVLRILLRSGETYR